MRQFKVLSTFESSEMKSTYVEGFSYTIIDGNRMLNALAEVWALQGKIEFVHQIKPHVEIKGQGIVEYASHKEDEGIWEKTLAAWGRTWQSLTRQR